ncbi:hypothetical protein HKX48_009381 [Thoreauomyces humboldtii]|nr:hypothetical protein HKX48_009381 [Thoreauomyces humboldtii]
MGNSESVLREPLHPQHPPVTAIDPRFCNPQPTTLVLREKIFSFSGDDFSIKDAYTGQPWFRIDGRSLSLRQKKTLLDVYGAPVANMKQELLAFVPNQKVFKGGDSSVPLLDIRVHVTFMKPKLSVVFRDVVTGEECEVGCKGDWIARNCLIWVDRGRKGEMNRRFVANVTSPILEGNNMFWDKQTYWLQVAPGMDLALLTLVCVALDERFHDKKKNSF